MGSGRTSNTCIHCGASIPDCCHLCSACAEETQGEVELFKPGNETQVSCKFVWDLYAIYQKYFARPEVCAAYEEFEMQQQKKQ